MDEVKLMKVIYCTTRRRGKGTELDPVRIVREIYSTDGKILAEYDSEMVFTKSDMCGFAMFVAGSDHKNVDALTLFKEWRKPK